MDTTDDNSRCSIRTMSIFSQVISTSTGVKLIAPATFEHLKGIILP
jgi:hypothetical protein